MRKFQALFLLGFVISLFSFVEYVRTEPVQNTRQTDQRTSSAADPLGAFLGNPGRSLPPASAYAVKEPLDAALPAWSERQEESAEGKLGWALWEMTQKTGEAAKTVKDSVKNSITDYVKVKHKQMRQEDLVDKFYVNLRYVTANLHLTPQDEEELTARVKRVYIEDAENGRYQLDSLRFRELPYIVRMEYAQMVLERTQNGEAETYYLNGKVQTHWHLKDGKPHGAVVTYYENGDISHIDLYEEGKKLRRSKYDEEGRLVFEQNYQYDGGQVPESAENSPEDSAAEEKPAAEESLDPLKLEEWIWPSSGQSSGGTAGSVPSSRRDVIEV